MISPFHILIASLMLNGFFVLVVAFCPMCVRLALARIMGKGLVIKLTKNRKLTIEKASKELEFYKTNDGLYEYEPEDIFTFNGCQSGLWYESYSKAADVEKVALITRLKKMGFDTATKLNNFLSIPTEQFEADNRQDLADIQQELNEDGYILDHLTIIRLRDLFGYIKARNPAALKGFVEREVHKERLKQNNPLANYFPYVIGAAVLIFALGVGYKMISTGDASGAANTASAAANAVSIR